MKAKRADTPSPVLDLMAALKRRLAHEAGETARTPKRKAASADRRQRNLPLPSQDKGQRQDEKAAARAADAKGRRKA